MGIDITHHQDGQVVVESRPRVVESSIGEPGGSAGQRVATAPPDTCHEAVTASAELRPSGTSGSVHVGRVTLEYLRKGDAMRKLGRLSVVVTVAALSLIVAPAALGDAHLPTCPGVDLEDPMFEGGNFILGTDGKDVLFGTEGFDVIIAGDGDDIIRALGGDDLMAGCGGDDVIDGGDGDDGILGDDLAFFGDPNAEGGNDRIHGGAGDDEILAGPGDDIVHGDSGNDFLALAQGDDQGYGGSGDDEIIGGLGDDSIFGQAGADSLFGGSHSDHINGGPGDDFIGGDVPTFFPPPPGVPLPPGDDVCQGAAGYDASLGCETNLAVEDIL
jgi:hypothetical protein